MGSNATQRTESLPAPNTNVMVDQLDDVDESGDLVMNLILRENVLAMQACSTRLGVGFGERRALRLATGSLRGFVEQGVRWRYEGREGRALSTAAIESRSPTVSAFHSVGCFLVHMF
jgi:hypothetical protein